MELSKPDNMAKLANNIDATTITNEDDISSIILSRLNVFKIMQKVKKDPLTLFNRDILQFSDVFYNGNNIEVNIILSGEEDDNEYYIFIPIILS